MMDFFDAVQEKVRRAEAAEVQLKPLNMRDQRTQTVEGVDRIAAIYLEVPIHGRECFASSALASLQ